MIHRMVLSDSSRHSGDSYNAESESVRLGKDEKLAREAGITFDVKVPSVSSAIIFIMYAVNVSAGHCEPADGRVQRPVEQARAHRGAA